MVVKDGNYVVDLSLNSADHSFENQAEAENKLLRIFKMDNTKKLLFCCLGIFICYFYYGILQEKITRKPYGEEQEKFTFILTLVFIQCIINAIFAYAVVKLSYGNMQDRTPNLLYICCSVTYVGAMLASNTALKYVNYPTQVLGKSCKPIPVMIMGVLLGRKRYPLAKYMCVLLIVTGVALFLYKDKKNVSTSDHVLGWGELMLVFSLTLDGLTGASQERMRSDYQTQSHYMMLSVNKWSILILGCAIVVTGEIWQFINFCTRYTYVIWNVIGFGLMSALGQNFIFMTVTNFGPLTCSVVTTTRKFFTILFSVLFFGNALITRQWFAVSLVFAGLSLDAIYGKIRKS